jgi:hypothetical protein
MMFEKLKAPFPPEKISWRVGSTNKKAWERDNAKRKTGIALAYIDARDVMERLDEVCGPQAWQALYPHANGKTSCKIGINIEPPSNHPEWVWKENGAGDSDVEAEKGAFSDAFKRAAVLWGIGRYLYDMPNIWVDLDDRWQIEKGEIEKKLYPALLKLTAGKIPEKPKEEKFTKAQQSLQQSFLSRLAECQDEIAIETLLEEMGAKIDTLPSVMMDTITDQVAVRRQQIKNNVNPEIYPYKYVNVAEAKEWFSNALIAVNGIKSLTVLDQWENHNRAKILGLSGLKAAVHRDEQGRTPKERLEQLLLDKRNQYTPIG